MKKTMQVGLTSLGQIRSIKGMLENRLIASVFKLSININFSVVILTMATVGLPKVATQSIQFIINTTARFITGVNK